MEANNDLINDSNKEDETNRTVSNLQVGGVLPDLETVDISGIHFRTTDDMMKTEAQSKAATIDPEKVVEHTASVEPDANFEGVDIRGLNLLSTDEMAQKKR